MFRSQGSIHRAGSLLGPPLQNDFQVTLEFLRSVASQSVGPDLLSLPLVVVFGTDIVLKVILGQFFDFSLQFRLSFERIEILRVASVLVHIQDLAGFLQSPLLS